MTPIETLKKRTSYNFFGGMFVILINVYAYNLGEHLLSIASLAIYCTVLVYLDGKSTKQSIRILEDFSNLADDFSSLAEAYDELRNIK